MIKKVCGERIRLYREANKDKQEYKDYNKNYTNKYTVTEQNIKKNIESRMLNIIKHIERRKKQLKTLISVIEEERS